MKNYRNVLLAKLFMITSLLGCMTYSGSEPMTMRRFQQIPIGISQEKLVAIAGKPYEIRKGRKLERYIYLERFTTPDGMRQDRRYVVEISGSKVTNKYFVREGESAIEFLLKDDS